MKQFELKPISQLFSAFFFAYDFFQIGYSEQSNKTHHFPQII